MANMNLLIAGTGGITFVDNTGSDIGYPVKMRLGVLTGGLLGLSANELVELLSMDHIPGQIAPNKTSLKSGVSLRPGHVLAVAYNQVPSSYNQFLYDWRADMRYSATELLTFLQQRKPANGRWNLVGHSQGGLLIILASKILMNAAAFEDLVETICFVGVPMAGTMNSARALIKGDQMGDAASPAFKTILRTWPSLYQMMPAWKAVVDSNGALAPDSDQLTRPGAWTGESGISDDLLTRAREVHALLRHPLDFLGDTKVSILWAKNRNTRVRVRKTAGGLDPDIEPNMKGDTLVPFVPTIRQVGEQEISPFVTSLLGVREHSRLLNDAQVLSLISQVNVP